MRVLCVGEMLVDIIVRPVEQVLLQNDTQLAREIRFSSGGDANNNAINLARLGNQVTYMGRLGRDEMGSYVARMAEAAGVDMGYAVRSTTADQTKSLSWSTPKVTGHFYRTPEPALSFVLRTATFLCWIILICYKSPERFISLNSTAKGRRSCSEPGKGTGRDHLHGCDQ